MKYLLLSLCLVLSLGIQAQENELTLTEIDGLEKLLKEQGNGVLLINFWATWCKPCVEELPQIEALHDQFSSDDIEIVLLSLDFENQIGSHLLPFIEEHNLRSTVSFLDAGDPNKWIDSVEPQWSGAIPFTLILDSTREKRWFFEGQLEDGILVKVLTEEFKIDLL